MLGALILNSSKTLIPLRECHRLRLCSDGTSTDITIASASSSQFAKANTRCSMKSIPRLCMYLLIHFASSRQKRVTVQQVRYVYRSCTTAPLVEFSVSDLIQFPESSSNSLLNQPFERKRYALLICNIKDAITLFAVSSVVLLYRNLSHRTHDAHNVRMLRKIMGR
jgi:hypothetical protein